MAAPAPDALPFFPLRRGRLATVVAALLVLHFVLAVGSKLHESTTADELIHLTAGLSYWQNNDYRLHPDNGNLPQRWAALPLWLAGAKFPALEGNDFWRVSDVYVVGHQFFYETGADHFPRLMAGRAMIALFSVTLGLLIFCWSRRLFGDVGALVSLGFFALSPAFLAHGALATSDVGCALFLLAAAGAWWRHLHDGRARAWVLSALLFGLALVTKNSGVLLVPAMLVMALVRAGAPEPLVLLGRRFTTPAGKGGAGLLSLVGHGAVALLVIWAFYGFRYSAFNPALPPALQFIRPWSELEAGLGRAARVIGIARSFHLLPEAYLYGFAYTLETTRLRAAFLNGEYSPTGWPTFFLWTFALKSTVPMLLACVSTAVLLARRWAARTAVQLRADLYRVVPLAVLLVVYGLSAVTSHLNIGERHILPIYPVLFIGVGLLGTSLGIRRRPAVMLLAALLGWQAVSAARIAPHFIAYFNELAGGPENGRHHLVDSSLDWGQDLPGLKTWLCAHAGTEPVYLSYFGSGEPAYYGLKIRRLAFLNNFKFFPSDEKLEPGLYCISATILMQVYGPEHGAWTTMSEQEFQRLRALEPFFAEYAQDPQRRAELERNAPASQWQLAIRQYDALRLARLCHYLRVRKPEAAIGYSILIYRLTAAEIAAATAGPLSEWKALIERTSQEEK